MRTTAVLAADTSLEVERTQVELWRRMSALEKLHAVSESTRAVLQLSLAGIRMRHPEAADEECRTRLAILKLGRELACRAFPEAARLRGL
jgi:hypothetical protein